MHRTRQAMCHIQLSSSSSSKSAVIISDSGWMEASTGRSKLVHFLSQLKNNYNVEIVLLYIGLSCLLINFSNKQKEPNRIRKMMLNNSFPLDITFESFVLVNLHARKLVIFSKRIHIWELVPFSRGCCFLSHGII